MNKTEQIKQYADVLRLSNLRNNAEKIIHEAQINNSSYLDYTHKLLEQEVKKRQMNDLERRRKLAKMLTNSDLDKYDYQFSCGITKSQMQQLRELIWVDQVYNLILMGPSGIGKSFIASGLINDAVNKGYKAYFTTMEDLIYIIKMKEMISGALSTYNRYLKAQLIAIDDIMMFPIKKQEATSFFNFINHLHEQCSIIITTNKSPQQWVETLEDEVLVTALLDRLLFHCQVIKLEGTSYRMDNRKTIFNK